MNIFFRSRELFHKFKMFNHRRLPGLLYNYRYITITSAIVSLTLLYYLLHWGFMCTNLETWHHVAKLCKLHQRGEAIGNLCKPLCDERTVHSLTCHSFHAGKEAVFSAEFEGTRLVFKAARRANGDNPDPVYWLDKLGEQRYPTEKEFESMIRDIVTSKFNLSISHDQVKKLSRLGFSRAKPKSMLRGAEMQNLWLLLQDNEYLCSSLYSDRDIFPQLLGTCGSYFAVEYVYPVRPITDVLSSDSHDEWVTRVKLGVMIMDLIDELETSLPEPFHLCDIKMSHFGIAKSRQRIKFLDLDTVLPRTIAGKLTGDGSHCSKHEDCDFFDCRSQCNSITSRCDNPVTNNNIQVVCEKIFLGWTLSGKVILPGLLMSQHTPTALASLLRQCANPDADSNRARTKPLEEIRRRLYTTLSEMEIHLTNELFI